MSKSSRFLIRVIALLAVAFGFLIVGFLVYNFIISKGEGTLAAAWAIFAACLILFGGLLIDLKTVAPAIEELATAAPAFAPLLLRVAQAMPGGSRKTDPPPKPATAATAIVEAALPQSGTVAAAHTFDPGA